MSTQIDDYWAATMEGCQFVIQLHREDLFIRWHPNNNGTFGVGPRDQAATFSINFVAGDPTYAQVRVSAQRDGAWLRVRHNYSNDALFADATEEMSNCAIFQITRDASGPINFKLGSIPGEAPVKVPGAITASPEPSCGIRPGKASWGLYDGLNDLTQVVIAKQTSFPILCIPTSRVGDKCSSWSWDKAFCPPWIAGLKNERYKQEIALTHCIGPNMTTDPFCKNWFLTHMGQTDNEISGWCKTHLDDPFCGCYVPTPKEIKDAYHDMVPTPICWNANCSTGGYKPSTILADTKPCPSIAICTQNVTSEGANNIIYGTSVKQDCSASTSATAASTVKVADSGSTSVTSHGGIGDPVIRTTGDFTAPVVTSTGGTHPAAAATTNNNTLYLFIVICLVVVGFLMSKNNNSQYYQQPYQQQYQQPMY